MVDALTIFFWFGTNLIVSQDNCYPDYDNGDEIVCNDDLTIEQYIERSKNATTANIPPIEDGNWNTISSSLIG